jgi:Tfp pilus assembly protein PilN
MINLLPPDVKESYHYARRNTRLVHWVFAMGFAFVGLAVISAGGIWYLNQQAKEYTAQIGISEERLRQLNQPKVEKEVKDIGDSLKLAVDVLSKEVLFSKLLKQIAVATPDGTLLSNLTISQIQGALDITALARDYSAATQLQVNLADPKNRIFSKADIVGISCKYPTGAATSAADRLLYTHPCTVNIRAQYAENNPFLFINDAKQAKP